MTATTVAQALTAAADLLEEKGWVQNVSYSKEGVCALAAIEQATSQSTDLYRKSVEHFSKFIPKTHRAIVPAIEIVDWNDDPAQTAQGVKQILRHAASLA